MLLFVFCSRDNFELMAMQIEKSGIKLAAIYRPLNNKFLNTIMERIRKKYICKEQIKKGISGVRDIVKFYKKNYSIALMIDQRVSEGIKVNFFKHKALTTTIPAQLVKKYKMPIVPVFIERFENIKFKITFQKPIYFSDDVSIENITSKLNEGLEKMIISNPESKEISEILGFLYKKINKDEESIKLGLIIRPLYHICVLSPALIINRSQIDELTEKLYQAISNTIDQLQTEGLWSQHK